jgi:hypothetical protein
LETLGLPSHINYGELKDFVRFETMSNLFYDENLEDKIEIKFDAHVFHVVFQHGSFIGYSNSQKLFIYDYRGGKYERSLPELEPLKCYHFKLREQFLRQEADFLLPPDAENLLTIILTRKSLKKLVRQLFDPFGLKMVLKPQERKIEVQKEIEDVIIAHPYSLVSDTHQRIIFYLAAIETNRDSVIVFEEPEVHAFPYYTTFLAERIALDKNNNQYFISTHNPYLLLSILEKAHKDEVALFITYFKDYQTKVKLLSKEELEEIMDMSIDVFFTIERFLEVQE